MANTDEIYRYTGPDLGPDGDHISRRQLEKLKSRSDRVPVALTFVVPAATLGDDTIAQSNRRSIMRDVGKLPGVFWLGDEQGVAFRGDMTEPKVLDLVDGLYDYPLYDEHDHSELEMEAQQEAVDDWAAHELMRSFAHEWRDHDDLVDTVRDLNSAGMFVEQFHELAQLADVRWEGTEIRIGNIARKLSESPLYLLNARDPETNYTSGWLDGGLSSTVRQLLELFGVTDGVMSADGVRVMLDYIWLNEGIQPEKVLGPFSEEDLERRMREEQVDPVMARQIGQLVAGLSPEGLARYETLANRFVTIDGMIGMVEAGLAEPFEDQVALLQELTPTAIQSMVETDRDDSESES